MAGYSSKSLSEKLGVKPAYRICLLNAPQGYQKRIQIGPDGAITTQLSSQYDLVQLFTTKKDELEKRFPQLVVAIKSNGMLWISWPKKASGVETDLTENIIRDIGLRYGVVDVKVAAIDDIWSGLKFVYRLKDR